MRNLQLLAITLVIVANVCECAKLARMIAEPQAFALPLKSAHNASSYVLNANRRNAAQKNVFYDAEEAGFDDADPPSSKTTIPLIIPAPAHITVSLNAKKILKKRKKNFSKMAKSLILLNDTTDYVDYKNYFTANDTIKFARSFTTAINGGMC